MSCPSCGYQNPPRVRYCARCRLKFNRSTTLFLRFRDHFFWIFRRAGAGFVSGILAWFFIPALSRVISLHSTAIFHFAVQGLLGGAFLGTVDGMMEESTPKTVRGALMGGFGGVAGGLVFGYFSPRLSPSGTMWGIFLFWATAGTLIGLVSALWERKSKKLIAGGLSGFIGGGVGGALGYAIYAYLIQEFDPEGWLTKRLAEGFSGGIIGLTLWFSIGISERFVIFKRTLIPEGRAHKHCHHCDAHNPLSSWYCADCGSVLQESAPAAKLNLSPYTTLDRVREMFRFLSRLSVTTGFIAAIIIFGVFFPVHKLLALVALILVAVLSYCLLIIFSALAESFQILLKKQPPA